jgi:LCP family protein required for cell wall assembly
MSVDNSSPESFPAAGTSEPSPPFQLRRTWPQRLTIAGVILAAFGSFAAGSVLFAAQRVVEDRNVVVLDNNAATASPNDKGSFTTSGDNDSFADQPLQPVETFPPAEPAARNFLITGADNNACIDPDSPYAGAFGDRASTGARSDTIMVWRINPVTSQVAVLSFPRDLWVTIAGRSSKQRINVAYERDNPQRLIDTIYQNFLIEVDHYIQVDFCAFKVLVDAAGGVSVPFDFPVRDPNTGLNVPERGCYVFNGDHALAYVRSRKLEYLTESGEWKQDGTSDLGRISRQQDFIRRTVDSLLAAGAFNPSVIRALIQTSDDYVVVDNNLTINKQLEFAGALREVDPADMTSYQIETRGAMIQGQSVLIPQTGGSNMQAILAVFQGDATLGSAPEQEFATTTTVPTTTAPDEPLTTSIGPATTLNSPVAVVDSTTTVVEAVPFETLPVVDAEVNSKGIFPNPSVSCF